MQKMFSWEYKGKLQQEELWTQGAVYIASRQGSCCGRATYLSGRLLQLTQLLESIPTFRRKFFTAVRQDRVL